jgi:hypothetical protein
MAQQIRHFILDDSQEHSLHLMAEDGSVLASVPAHLRTETLRRKGRRADPETWPIVNVHRLLICRTEPSEADRIGKYVYQRGDARVPYKWNGQEGLCEIQSTKPGLKIRLPKPEAPADAEGADSPCK